MQDGLFGSEVTRKPGKRRLTEEPVYNKVLHCTSCSLSQLRTPVPYRGPVPAKVAVVGEAPGYQEDAKGGPFLGPAGQLLAEQFRIHKVIPERLFYMNIVSCFPTSSDGGKSSKPSAKSIAACNDNVWAQLRLASPQWVVLVGGVACEALAPWPLWNCSPRKISDMRGLVWTWEGMHWTPIIHPAAGLREKQYMEMFQQDMTKLVSMLRSGPEYGEECFICGTTVYRYDYTGMPFCAQHYRDVEFGKNKGAKLEDHSDQGYGTTARARQD